LAETTSSSASFRDDILVGGMATTALPAARHDRYLFNRGDGQTSSTILLASPAGLRRRYRAEQVRWSAAPAP
jgi:hypothetical protein